MAKAPKQKYTPLLLRGVGNVLEFGKHKGKQLSQVMREDPNWIHWALQNVPTFKLNKNALLLLPPYIEPDDERTDHYGDMLPNDNW